MNEIKLPSGETARYQYDPRSDGLEIHLRAAALTTSPEPLARGDPHVRVRRDPATGEVVSVEVHGVQGLILEHLVRDLVALACADAAPVAPDIPDIAPASAPVPAPAAPAAAPAMVEAAPEPPPPVAAAPAPPAWTPPPPDLPAPPPAPPPSAPIAGALSLGAGLPLVYDDMADAADGPPEGAAPPGRRKRRRRRRRGGAGPVPGEAAVAGDLLEPASDTWPAMAAPPAEIVAEVVADTAVAAVDPQADDEPATIVSAPVGWSPSPWPPMLLLGGSADSLPPPAPPVLPPLVPPTPPAGPAAAPERPTPAESAPPGPPAAGEPRRQHRRHRSGRGERDTLDGLAPEGPGSAALAPAPAEAAEAIPDGRVTPAAFQDFGLDERLGAGVATLGFEEPTLIQRRAIPIALAGRDLMGLAQTGTGKTAAFLLPALQRLLADPDPRHRPRLLVVTPTRELAVQVGDQAAALARFTPLRTVVVYGGAGMITQTDALRRGVDVIVATPGRLLDHVSQRNVRLDTVQVLVLDESDRMLDMGFIPEVRRILSLLPAERQSLLFGATLPPDIEALSRKFQRDPEIVEVARQLPPATLDQTLLPVGRHLKLPLLVHLLKADVSLSKVLVFTETKIETDIVARKLAEAGLKVASMHGDRPQKERESALAQLKDGRVQVLVATNVAARGLDIEDVSHVVNYDMPQTVDEYIHRIGRTARGAAEGTAYTFVTLSDEGMVLRIESALDRALPRLQVEGFDYDVPTPSWAQPSAQDLARHMAPPSLTNLSRSFHRGVGRRRK